MKTLLELEVEAAAAQQALNEARSAAQALAKAAVEAQEEVERKAKRIAEIAALELKMQRVTAPTVQALKAAGLEPTTDGYRIYTVGTLVRIEMKETYIGGSTWSRRGTSSWAVYVTNPVSYQDKRFPELKAGGHNYPAIVKTVQEFAALLVVKKLEETKKAADLVLAAGLCEKLQADFPTQKNKVSGYMYVSNSKYGGQTLPAPAGKVYVKLNGYAATEEEACILLKALDEIENARNKK